MITLINLSKNFTGRTLFKDVTLSIFANERIGLTGPNGSGKSTLYSIIRGEMEPTSGEVQMQKKLNIGYLPQEAHFDSDQTVMEEISSGDDRIKRLLREKHRLEDENKAGGTRYGDILEELETLGIYELEHKAEKILSGLGFKEEQFHMPIRNLSGGWQMRTLLAKLLVYPYDLLLLDEPTNYLDLSATIWLKDFLSGYPGTFIVISHDKIFLNDVTNYTIVLENGMMNKIKGNYEAYEEQKEVLYKTLEKKQKVVEKKKKQLERFAQRFHAQPNRASAVRNKRKMIERLKEEEVDLPQERHSIRDFEFPPTTSSGYTVLTAKDISKSYKEKCVYKDLNLEILRGQKICLVGPNGAGKSTLLKMLAGVLKADTGSINLGHQVTRGYFSQTRLDVLNPNRNVLEELASVTTQSVPAVQMRSLLALFNFHGDDVFKMVRVLSGGEKSRLILAKLLLNPPNFILLDEPTTHLDLEGVTALTKALRRYEGTICFISHDLFFIREIADQITEVTDGWLKNYPGGLKYYLHKKETGETLQQKKEKKVQERKAQEKQARKKEKQAESEQLRALRDRHKSALKRVNQIKKQVEALEKEKEDLETESYVKSRVMQKSYGKDPEVIKEYGRRLKWIPKRLREIETEVNALNKEKERITR